MRKVFCLLVLVLILVPGCAPSQREMSPAPSTSTPAIDITSQTAPVKPPEKPPKEGTTTPLEPTKTQVETSDTLPLPGSPKNLKGELEDPYLKDYKAVLLNWDEMPGASGYRVYVSDTKNGKYRKLQETKTTSCRIADELPKPAYFTVTAINNTGESSHSAVVRVDTGLIREGLVDGPSGERNDIFGDNIFRSLAVSRTDPNLVYVGSEGNGLFCTMDGGATWTRQRTGLLYMAGVDMHGPEYGEGYDIAIDPVNPLKVYAAIGAEMGPVEGDYPSSLGGVYYTCDGGTTWERRYKGLLTGATGAIAVTPDDPSALFLGMCGGISTFSGFDTTGGFYDGGIYKSTNDGMTWTRLALPDPEVAAWSDFWKIVAWDSMNIYTLGQKDEDPVPAKALGLVKSTDGGVTWQKISPPNIFFSSFDVAPKDKNVVYGVSYYSMYQEGAKIPSTVFCSKDGGTTWQPLKDYKM